MLSSNLYNAVFSYDNLCYAEENPAVEHVFIFGHPNLWNFNYFRFNENYGLLDIISKFKKVDAYFRYMILSD